MIYLATPYMDTDPIIREHRYFEAMKCVNWYLESRIHLYSPILYCHPMAKTFSMPKDESFWRWFDESAIIDCGKIWFLLVDGWKTSAGMKREHDFAWAEFGSETGAIQIVRDLGGCYANFILRQPLSFA